MNQVAKPHLPVLDTSHPLAVGLTGCWPLWERGGTATRDVSGRNLDHIGVFDATWLPYGVDLANDTDKVELGTSRFGITTSFSIVFRLVVRTTVNGKFVFSRSPFVRPINFSVQNNEAFKLQIATDGDNVTETTPASSYVIGVPLNVAITWNGATAYIYKNGTVLDSNSPAAPDPNLEWINNTTEWTIGEGTGIGGSGFDGEVYHFYIYNRALKSNEVAELHADPYAMLRPHRTLGFVAAAPPGGLSIPVAMHHYKQLMGVN